MERECNGRVGQENPWAKSAYLGGQSPPEGPSVLKFFRTISTDQPI